MLEGWPESYCTPHCIYDNFPQWIWGLWEIFGHVLAPLGAGMAVVWTINEESLERWAVRAGFTPEEIDAGEVHSILRQMLSIWENTKEDLGIDTAVINFILSLGKEAEDGPG
jgi:hypothetical protein